MYRNAPNLKMLLTIRPTPTENERNFLRLEHLSRNKEQDYRIEQLMLCVEFHFKNDNFLKY
jgi:hypothetical protein